MAATRFDQPEILCRAHHAADIDAGNGAGGSTAHAAFEPGDKRRLGETLLQTSRHNTDHARMPAVIRHQQKRHIVLCCGQCHGFFQDQFFDALALAIVKIELKRKILRRLHVPRGKQVSAQP